MEKINEQFNRLVDELIEVLDCDIEQTQEKLEAFDALRAALIRRDMENLTQLLDKSQQQIEHYNRNEQHREELRLRLSRLLGCPLEHTNLTKLCSRLDSPRRSEVTERHEKLKQLVPRLKREHVLTTLLLRECSRLNQKMLQNIFGRQKEGTTYNRRGDSNWQADKRLLSYRM